MYKNTVVVCIIYVNIFLFKNIFVPYNMYIAQCILYTSIPYRYTVVAGLNLTKAFICIVPLRYEKWTSWDLQSGGVRHCTTTVCLIQCENETTSMSCLYIYPLIF